jgi:ribosomal protein S18 acetylase RimI-like enzyme
MWGAPVQVVSLKRTRALRRNVLRPHETIEDLAAREPEGALALGAFDDDELISVGLVAPDGEPGGWRVQGMATTPSARRRGAGTAVLAALIRHAREQGATRIWCNARTPARSLYERAGLWVASEEFELPDIGPHVVMEWRAAQPTVRSAGPGDAPAVGRLLDEFNREYDEPTPGPAVLARRIVQLLTDGDTAVLLTGPGPDGLAVLRFRRAIWSDGLECYLAELYVVPGRRGHGLGRGLMQAALELARERGAAYIELGTSENDVAARALYESLGFSNREGRPDGPVNFYYEREL